MATAFPSGYVGAVRTWDQLMTMKTIWNLHPEVRRRVLALMTAAHTAGIPLGPGTGWRKQPTNPDGSGRSGFACRGNSYHEGFATPGVRPNGSNDSGAMALDMVPSSSWPWMDAHCHLYGFRHFANVNNEPWHIQPFEIPGSRNYATIPPRLLAFNLPGDPEVDLPMTPTDIAIVVKLIEDRLPAIAAAVWGRLLDHPTDGASAIPASTFLYYILRNCGDLFEGDAPGSGPTKPYYDQTTALIRGDIAAIPGGGGGGGGGVISDEDLARIAVAVADEQHRRSES